MEDKYTIPDMFFVYKTPTCSWCSRVIKLIESYRYSYITIDITKDDSSKEFIVDTLGLKTVPQVFHNDKHIGGFEDTQAYLKTLNVD